MVQQQSLLLPVNNHGKAMDERNRIPLIVFFLDTSVIIVVVFIIIILK